MRWPWVSRARLDAAERLVMFAAGETAAAEVRETDARGEVKRLVDLLVEMRREGFTPAPPSYAPDATADLPEAVMRAIHARSAPGTETFRQLVRGAQQALTPDGSNSEDVADLVYRGAGDEEDQ